MRSSQEGPFCRKGATELFKHRSGGPEKDNQLASVDSDSIYTVVLVSLTFECGETGKLIPRAQLGHPQTFNRANYELAGNAKMFC